MSTVFTEGPHAGNYIADEVSINLSRAPIVVASGAGVVLPGTVLGRITATGKYVPMPAVAATTPDGSETAAAILFDRVDATSADANAVATTTLTAVNAGDLIWPDGITENAKATAIATLEALQIRVLPAATTLS